jgi:hypothetical protein
LMAIIVPRGGRVWCSNTCGDAARLWSFNDDDERGARSISRSLVCPSCHAEAFETLDVAGPYRAIYQLLDTFCWGTRLRRRRESLCSAL